MALSHGQQRLWFLQQLNPENPFYNHSESYVFLGKLNTNHLKHALQLMFETHDILRSTYILEDGQLSQKLTPNFELKIPEYDFTNLSETDFSTSVEQIKSTDANGAFDLSTDPLLRVALIKKSEEEHVLFLTLHHIIGDRWSLEVFNKQLASYYLKLSSGEQTGIEELPIQYQDFAYWQLNNPINEKQLGYWQEKLSGEIPQLELPKDFKPPLKPTFKGALQLHQFSTELSNNILVLSKELGATPYVLILSVYYILLSKYSGQNDILIGSPVSNRDQQVLENLMGFFNDTVVLRTKLKPDLSFKKLVELVRTTTLEAFENKDVPFESLVKSLKPKRSLSTNPFFQTMFLYNSVKPMPSFGDDLTVESTTYDSGTSKFDLTLFVNEENGILSSKFEYNTDLFEATTIHRIQEHFELLLKGVIQNPNELIFQIPMLTKKEKTIFFDRANEKDFESNTLKPIHSYIEKVAKENPNKIALRYKDDSVSYFDLDKRATEIAMQILTKTNGKNKIIGLCMNRSSEMIIGMLAILKAGCAYLPIDPEYPEQRIEFMLQDSNVDLILSNGNEISIVKTSNIEIIDINKTSVKSINNNSNLPQSKIEDIAYVIYTSGSTGKPKGVPISHENITNSTLGRTDFYGHDPKSFLLLSSIAFDSSKAGIFWTLCTGGTLVISEKRMEQDIDLLANTIKENSVSHTLMLPSLYNLLLDNADSTDLKSLQTVIVAGEACTAKVCQKHFDTMQQTDLYNEYGPTEATVWCVAHKIEIKDTHKVIPIGQAVAGANVHILNDKLENVSFGAIGELCISGKGLAKGYINLPTDTAEKFVNVTLEPGSDFNTRIYRTGDLARYRADGTIEFLGRKDAQVKIRGFRIELNEIQDVIAKSKSVETVIVAVENQQDIDETTTLDNLEMDELLTIAEKSIGLEALETILNSIENLDDSKRDILTEKV
nr:amino acid adenylation domain-containing protein [Aurantibacter crassamenti]